MKKVILSIAIVTAVALTSCGGGQSTEVPCTDSTKVCGADTCVVAKSVDTATVSVADTTKKN